MFTCNLCKALVPLTTDTAQESIDGHWVRVHGRLPREGD